MAGQGWTDFVGTREDLTFANHICDCLRFPKRLPFQHES